MNRTLVLQGLLLFLFGIGFGLLLFGELITQDGYKQGQLDYQSGRIEWSIIDGKLHRIMEADHERR